MELEAKDRLVLPLDVADIDEANEIISSLKEGVGVFKVNSLFTHCGCDIVEAIQNANCKVFLDLKFHDIPNTVANYSRIAARMGVYMFNVHCSGGLEMMKAAADASRDESEKLGFEKPLVLGVTILTSIDQKSLNDDLRINGTVVEQVVHLAKLAKKAGLDGVVASPHEIEAIKKACGKDFVVLTPGIRPKWSLGAKDDQKRIMTPADAIKKGSDFIVIGRPILEAKDRKDAAKKVLDERR
ncbi:orotidine-5'-phosphate decarboxylase [Candidatus Woesearchaeota archaeon CG10_big_fil_rev_8_21_14_0_10_44_13]|nr:MAG: orotidine-5'-phosphate decarboxylase [Candidatus Woesearchaeota archaeon CG10_big_fil_rev_8_21_14_0_10_44_13]